MRVHLHSQFIFLSIFSEQCNVGVPCENCACAGCSRTTLIAGSLNWCKCCLSARPDCSSLSQCSSSVFQRNGCESAGFCQQNSTGDIIHCGRNRFPDNNFCQGYRRNCVVSPFSDFSQCSRRCTANGGSVPPGEIPNGVQTRSRFVFALEENGGEPCPALTETRACNNVTACPQTCVVSEWTVGPCTDSCGGGLQMRTRTVLVQPTQGGGGCPSLTEIVGRCDVFAFVCLHVAAGRLQHSRLSRRLRRRV